MPAAACSPFARLRTARTTRAPARPSARAATSPMPLFAPVTTNVLPASDGRSAAVHFDELRRVNLPEAAPDQASRKHGAGPPAGSEQAQGDQ